jgi:hypothetical protein
MLDGYFDLSRKKGKAVAEVAEPLGDEEAK